MHTTGDGMAGQCVGKEPFLQYFFCKQQSILPDDELWQRHVGSDIKAFLKSAQRHTPHGQCKFDSLLLDGVLLQNFPLCIGQVGGRVPKIQNCFGKKML